MKITRHYWLLKTEASSYSIDDLLRDKVSSWTGIRNFQARNHIRDGMQSGDRVLIYHSSGTPSAPTGIYGIAEILSDPYLDPTALDARNEHYDARVARAHKEGKLVLRSSKRSGGIEGWTAIDVRFVRKLKHPVLLADIKNDPILRKMLVAKPGQRLSVLPVTEEEFGRVVGRGERASLLARKG